MCWREKKGPNLLRADLLASANRTWKSFTVFSLANILRLFTTREELTTLVLFPVPTWYRAKQSLRGDEAVLRGIFAGDRSILFLADANFP
jgi:hypothetical protein